MTNASSSAGPVLVLTLDRQMDCLMQYEGVKCYQPVLKF